MSSLNRRRKPETSTSCFDTFAARSSSVPYVDSVPANASGSLASQSELATTPLASFFPKCSSPSSTGATAVGPRWVLCSAEGRHCRRRRPMLWLPCIMLIFVAALALHSGLASTRNGSDGGVGICSSGSRHRTAGSTSVGVRFICAFEEPLSAVPPQPGESVPNLGIDDKRQRGTGECAGAVGSPPVGECGDAAYPAGASEDTNGRHQRWHDAWRGIPFSGRGRRQRVGEDPVGHPDWQLIASVDETMRSDSISATRAVERAEAESRIFEAKGRTHSAEGLGHARRTVLLHYPQQLHGGSHRDRRSYGYPNDDDKGGAAGAVPSPAREAPRYEDVGNVQANVDDDSRGVCGEHQYPRGDENARYAKEDVERVEEAVYGSSESRTTHGCVYCKDAQSRDDHAHSPSSSSAWWFSRGKVFTGFGSTPSSGAQQSVPAAAVPTTAGASTIVNREVAPHDSVTQHLLRDAEAQRPQYRSSYPTLRELVQQLERADEDERRVRQMCFTTTTAIPTARDDGKFRGRGATNSTTAGVRSSGSGSRCGSGCACSHHRSLNTSGSESVLQGAPAAVDSSDLCGRRASSLDWVQYLRYVPLHPIEEALRHLEHEEDDDMLMALFYAPDLFTAYNYVQWMQLMVRATCLLLRAGVLDPITYIRDDGVDPVFSSQMPPSGATESARGSDGDSSNSSCGSDTHCKRGSSSFCSDLVLPSLEGLLRPEDIKRMRENRVRIAIIDGYYPHRNISDAAWRVQRAGTANAPREKGDDELSGCGVDAHRREVDANRSMDRVEAPTASDIGNCGVMGGGGEQGRLQEFLKAAVSPSAPPLPGSSEPPTTRNSDDPMFSIRTGRHSPMFVQHRDALLRLLSLEDGVSDDYREAPGSVSWFDQQGGATKRAKATGNGLRDVHARRGQDADDGQVDWLEHRVLEGQQRHQQHANRLHAHNDTMMASDVVRDLAASRTDAEQQAGTVHKDSIAVKATAVGDDAGLRFLPFTPLRAEEAGLNTSDMGKLNHTSGFFDALQHCLDEVRQRRQRLVEKIFSWGQVMKYQLHANASAQRMAGFSSGNLCDPRYQAVWHSSRSAATTAAGGNAVEDTEDEEAVVEYDEALEEPKRKTADLEGDACDVSCTSAWGAQCVGCTCELAPANVLSTVLRAQGGGIGEPHTEASSMRAGDAASTQGARSSSNGVCGDGKGAVDTLSFAEKKMPPSCVSDSWRRQYTTARRHYLLRQSPPVLLFPRRQGSNPYFFPQTLLRFVQVSFPESKVQLSPQEHARQMQSRWGCTPVRSDSSVEGVGIELPTPAGGAPVLGNTHGCGGDDKASTKLKGACAAAAGGGQLQNRCARFFSSPRRSHNGVRGAGTTPPSPKSSFPTWLTYRVVSVLDNPFSRIAVGHLQYHFLIHGPSSPTSILELLVEESRRVSAPGELEMRTQRENLYRLGRRQWLRSRPRVSEGTTAANSVEEVSGGGGNAEDAGNADTTAATETKSGNYPRRTALRFPYRPPHHANGVSTDHHEPGGPVDGRRQHGSLHRSHQRPLEGSDHRTRNGPEDYFFEHDSSFRLDPERFAEVAPLTLNFFLRTPMHIIEEEVIRPLQQKVEALRQGFLEEIAREARSCGRCEIISDRYMQLLTYGTDALHMRGTQQSAPASDCMAAPYSAEHLIEKALDVDTRSGASHVSLRDDELSTLPYCYTADGRRLLEALRSSAALRVWQSAGDFRERYVEASTLGTFSGVNETRGPIRPPHDLASLVELLHQPYGARYNDSSRVQPLLSSTSLRGLSEAITNAAAVPLPLMTDGDGSSPLTPTILLWDHNVAKLDVACDRQPEGHQTFLLQHERQQKRMSMLRLALGELLRRTGRGWANAFFQLIPINSEESPFVDPLWTEPCETATTVPNGSSVPPSTPRRPKESLKHFSAHNLAVVYLFFNGTAEAYFRRHPLNQRRMSLLQRLDEAVRLARHSRLIRLTATEEDYRAQYVDSAVHAVPRRLCMYRQERTLFCGSRQSS